MSPCVITVEVPQLLMGVIRGGALVMTGCCMDFTLVYHSTFIHTSHDHQVYPHLYSYILGRCYSLSICGGDAERDIVVSYVVFKTIRSQGYGVACWVLWGPRSIHPLVMLLNSSSKV
jgi:hypothetical protein